MSQPLAIDIVSDVVCPWCYIGKRRLEAMLARRAEPVELRWRPFQLDATIPAGGLPRDEYLARKFGREKIAAIHERIAEAGAAAGLAFAFERITISPNTLDAHRLIRWATIEGAQDRVVEALFAAYFAEGRDIGDHATLTDLAGERGLDRGMIARLLATDAERDAAREEIAAAARMGVTGVPFFIFDGRLAVSGAQPPEILARAMDQALEQRGA